MPINLPPRFLPAAALLSVLICYSPLSAQSRSDSLDIERAISVERLDIQLSYPGRARMLLLRRLRMGESLAARRLHTFMSARVPGESADWLTASEQLIVETLIGDSLLVRDTARLERLLVTAKSTEQQSIFHADNLYHTLRDILRGQADATTARFMSWEPTEQEQRFINLLINHLYIRGLRAQEDLNERVDDFARRMPSAPLLPIAQRHIRKDYAEADFGAAFSAGYSLGTFDGAIRDVFDFYHGPSLAGELYIYRTTIAGHINFGVAHAAQEFTAGGEVWEKGYASFLNASLCAGREFRFGRLAFTPLAGIAMQSVRGADSSGVDEADIPRTRDRVGLEIGGIIGYRIPSDQGTHIDLRARVGRTWSGISSYDPSFSGALWYIQFAFALVQRPYDAR